MITENAFTKGRSLIETIIEKMHGIGKCQRKFIREVLILVLTLPGRMNFLQMGRYGKLSEQSYRMNFEKEFDFLAFNQQLVANTCSDELIIGFDPSYIPKSGKHTPGIGNFYSGCAGQYKRGLEISGLCAIDIRQNTAYHLEAVQSPPANRDRLEGDKSLVDHYAEVIVSRAEKLLCISTILVADGYFAKKKFVDSICENTEMELISRMRDDANLRYLYKGPKRFGKGRPKKYAGKIDVSNIDKRRLRLTCKDAEMKIYEGVVYSVGLKRNIKIAYQVLVNSSGSDVKHKIFFSTNTDRSGYEIVKYYRARYQMEFVFRDAKQYAGLEHCQARSSKKLHFHFNASLTSVSVAKAVIRTQVEKDKEIVLSISDIKTELYNRLLACRIFSIYGLNPKIIKNDTRYRQILNFGKIAA